MTNSPMTPHRFLSLRSYLGLLKYSSYYRKVIHPTNSLLSRYNSSGISNMTGQIFRRLQCPQCDRSFRMQAALDHHLVTSHTGAPDTEPKKAKGKKIVHEVPKYFGTMYNRVDIIKKREGKEPDDPQVFNPFELYKIAPVPRTSANTVLDRLGTDLLPTKKHDLSGAEMSASAGSWTQAERTNSSAPSTFPDIETVLEMDPFIHRPFLEKKMKQADTAEKLPHTCQTPAKALSESQPAPISLPRNPFASEVMDHVTNPFAPQPDGIGSYNYFASQLNKKLAIERMNTGSKTNLNGPSNFTPFHSHGAFPDAPKQSVSKSFFPLAFAQTHDQTMKSCSSMNDSVVSFVQGRSLDSVHSASPFKHGMHTQLEVPRSPYIAEIRDRVHRIIPSEEPQAAIEMPNQDEVITFVGEKSSTRWSCFCCTKTFFTADALIKHLSDTHVLNYTRRDLDDLQKSPFSGFRRGIDIRQGVQETEISPRRRSTVTDDMQTEYLRKAFTSGSCTQNLKSSDEDIAAHLTSVNRAVFVGVADNIEAGSIHGNKFVRFSLTIPFDSAPAGEHASDTVTILCDCTPKKDSSPCASLKDEHKSSTRLQKGKQFKLRNTHLQERRAKQISEIESHILCAANSGASICVSGHLCLNPQNTKHGKRFFPVVTVMPSSGFITII